MSLFVGTSPKNLIWRGKELFLTGIWLNYIYYFLCSFKKMIKLKLILIQKREAGFICMWQCSSALTTCKGQKPQQQEDDLVNMSI